MMAGMLTSISLPLMDLAFAPGTPPSLFVPDKPPHSGDHRPFFEPVLHTAGGLTAEGTLVSPGEVHSFAAATGTGFRATSRSASFSPLSLQKMIQELKELDIFIL